MRKMDNNVLLERARSVMPGGVSSPVRAFDNVGATPFVVNHADGSLLYCSDGRKYVDFVCSFGPNILGHNHPLVTQTVQRAAEDGLSYGATSENEILLAEMIVDAIPSAQMVRFVSSGTEAAMSAIRLARGVTGRDYIIKFRGCYHGHSDGLLAKGGSGLLTGSVPDCAGVPSVFTEKTLIAEYNDPAGVEKYFEAYRDKIAAVIVEPVAANMGVVAPADGFLSSLRRITAKNGAMLIFDEVITGFRLSYNGAQGYYGVTPDITVLGKIIGGGLPVGAYCASREIMGHVAPLGDVYQAGTLSGSPAAMAAGLVTLRILRDNPGIYNDLEEKASKIADAFNRASAGMAVANHVGSLLTFFMTDKMVNSFDDVMRCDTEKFSRLFNFLLSRGFYIPPSQYEALFLSTAHTDGQIDELISSFFEYEWE